MHRDCVGKIKIARKFKGVSCNLVKKFNDKRFCLSVNPCDDSYVTVENSFARFAVITIPANILVDFYLHNLVACTKGF